MSGRVLPSNLESPYKVNLHLFDLTGPAIETEDLICKIDDLFCCKIVYLSSSVAWSCRYVLRSQLLVKATLQYGDLFRCVF